MHGDVTTGTMTRRAATSAQIHAVYTAMRILAEDDRERGVAGDTFVCAACRRHRSTAGAIRYASTHLCNGCATDFEVLRIAGLVSDVEGYLCRGLGATTAG